MRARPVALRNTRSPALVPCHNEEVAIAKVVRDFRAALPTATIFVFDKTDNTAAAVRAAVSIDRVPDTVMRGRREMKLAYLAHRAPGEERRRG